MVGHAIFGLIIGLLARVAMPGYHHMGLILTMILGLVGAWLGGVIGRAMGMYREGHPAGFLMAFCRGLHRAVRGGTNSLGRADPLVRAGRPRPALFHRCHEHTSELQSLRHLVCRLLL